jgi:putative DNA primase/helicase
MGKGALKMRDDIYEAMRGKWRSVMMHLGMEHRYLTGKHGPCPMCGGKDRWRFDDKNEGWFFCTHCGSGKGVSLVMTWKRLTYMEAAKLIEATAGMRRIEMRQSSDEFTPEQQKAKMHELWNRSLALDGSDIASRYLAKRAITMAQWPACLRCVKSLAYWDGKQLLGYFSAMVAKYVAADSKSAILQRLYLEEPGEKAPVLSPRKMMAGHMEMGGACRLFPAAETMGVAEGIESALSAYLLFEIPVWATLTANALHQFQPPPECRKLIVFADYDPNGDGEAAAHALAHRLLKGRKPIAASVKPPNMGDVRPAKADWNDVLMAQRRSGVDERQLRRA